MCGYHAATAALEELRKNHVLGQAGLSVTAQKVRSSLSPADPGVYCYQVSPCPTAAGFDCFYLRRWVAQSLRRWIFLNSCSLPVVALLPQWMAPQDSSPPDRPFPFFATYLSVHLCRPALLDQNSRFLHVSRPIAAFAQSLVAMSPSVRLALARVHLRRAGVDIPEELETPSCPPDDAAVASRTPLELDPVTSIPVVLPVSVVGARFRSERAVVGPFDPAFRSEMETEQVRH